MLSGLGMSTGQLWLQGISIGLSTAVLGVVLWVNFGRDAWRSRKMRRPFEARFKAAGAGDPPTCTELRVPANSEVQIDFRILPRLHYVQNEMVVGFEGEASQRPVVKSVSNLFVKEGAMRKRAPATNERHYIDYDDNYHIGERLNRIKGNHYAIGFLVETKGPGRFPVRIEAVTDDGEGKAYNRLTLVVE